MVTKVSLPMRPESVQGASYPGHVRSPRAPGPGQPSFAAVLRQEVESSRGIRFSNHAIARLQARGIQLDESQRDRIEKAVEAADRKGAKESLILLDDLALVVSIRTRTVITAIDAAHRKSNVFTNIDSAVLA